MRRLARRFASLVLAYDRRQLHKGKPAPVSRWAVRMMVGGAR